MNVNQTRMFGMALILFATCVLGCGAQPSPSSDATATLKDHGHSHEQGHSREEGHSQVAGPHDGTIADWGGGVFHVELIVDHDKQDATVYVLGDDAKTVMPIATDEIQLAIKSPTLQVTMKAMPQENDPEGTASRFVGNHEGLGTAQEYEGTITGVVDGTPYSGNFSEVAHTHHH